MREDRDDKPLNYWIVHGTNLLRVAPIHIRPRAEDHGRCLEDDIDGARQQAEGIRTRSTTQYVDLTQQPGPRLDESDTEHEDENMDMHVDPSAASAAEAPVSRRQTIPQPEGEPAHEPQHAPEPPHAAPEPPVRAAQAPVPSDSEDEAPRRRIHGKTRVRSRSPRRAQSSAQSSGSRNRNPVSVGDPQMVDAPDIDDELCVLPSPWEVQGDVFTVSERHLAVEDRALFMKAKREELDSFFKNEVWEVAVPDDETRTLRARFLLKWRDDGSAKARLVVQGFRDPDALNGTLATSSPTATRLARHCVFAVAAINQWTPWTADVATAFLQGKPQDRTLFVKVPAEAATLMGLKEGECMKLLKPMYGQTDAPRAWYLEARDRMLTLGFIVHPLDPCLFMSFQDNVSDTVLDGVISVHVDDLLGCGNLSSTYADRIAALKAKFQFRTWEEIVPGACVTYLGAQLTATNDPNDAKLINYNLSYGAYLRKVKPISIRPGAGDQTPANYHDVKQLRGLLGSLQWPASQGCPHLTCSTSLLQGMFSTATVAVMKEANKALRFAKNNADVGVQFPSLQAHGVFTMEDIGFVTMTDAAWAVRSDGSSQGGFLTLLVPKIAFEDKATAYIVMDWRSFKLTRVSRSSLNSEAQAAAGAVDNLDYVKTFWQLMKNPWLDPRGEDTTQRAGPSCLIVDAKSLYDASQKEHIHNFQDRRTGIEVMVIKQTMRSSGSTWRWCSSERQYADGLTKMAARQLLCDRLRNGTIQLVHDDSFQAAKKKDAAARRESQDKHASTRASWS